MPEPPAPDDTATVPLASRAWSGDGLVALAPGTAVGRYQVVEHLGDGAMGVVYAAQDPELGRRVALKLVRAPRTDAASAGAARGRLLGEAQALAQLSHPNVVAIHDVGTFEDAVFIAMELVEGRSLRRVLEDGDLPWRARLGLLLDAGRGLAAAHRAGLVHRDFKPENVLVGADGRVRVVDFGLARAAGEDPAQEAGAAAGEGTPGYMAPEQRAAGTVSALSDQYGFCVTAWELLHGERPPAGDAAGSGREPRWVGSPVPARLRRILSRGSSRAPAQRYPSMDALLAALAHDPAVLRTRIAGAAAIAAAAAGLTLALVLPGRTRVCGDGADRIAEVWGDPTRAAVQRAFRAAGRGYGEDTFARVDQALGTYLASWARMRREACEATRVAGVQSERLLDLRMRCLDRRLQRVDALARLFGREESAPVLRQALAAVYELPPLDRCADAAALAAARPPPDDPAVAAAVREVMARVERANALLDAGAFLEGLEVASAAAEDARRTGHDPAVAEALQVLGRLQNRAGQLAAADATARAALLAGARAGEDAVVAGAWALLLYNLGAQARYAEALALREAGEAAVARAGDDPLLRGQLLASVGAVLNRQDRYADARPYLERAVAALEGALGPDHPRLAGPLSNLANLLAAYGQHADAERAYARAIAIYERSYGPAHPMLAVPLGNRANMRTDQGRYEDARPDYLRALAVTRQGLGTDHPVVANTLNNLGALEQEQGDLAAADARFAEAQAIWERTLGPDHPDLAMAISNRGILALRQGRAAAACAAFERALAIEERHLAADDPSLAFPLTGLGECRLALGRATPALPALERALRIRSQAQAPTPELARTRFALARALAALGRTPRRARALAEEAAAGVRTGHGAEAAALRTEIAAWLGRDGGR